MIAEPGLYKIKFNGGFHLLRVVVQGGRKMFKIDHGPYEPIERLHKTEEYMEVICKINERTISGKDIVAPSITIGWEDTEGRRFRMTMRDLWTLKNILLDFPFLQEPFQYVKKKLRNRVLR